MIKARQWRSKCTSMWLNESRLAYGGEESRRVPATVCLDLYTFSP